MKTIVWDIDDVLNDLMRSWLEKHHDSNHQAKLSYHAISENPPHTLLGISEEKYLSSLDDYRLGGCYNHLQPTFEIKKWFEVHGSYFRHIALTKVPVEVAHVSAGWVVKHFGMWIRTFHFIPSHRIGEKPIMYDDSKGSFLHYLNKVDLFIDDHFENCESAKQAGVKTLVYPRPWNKSRQTTHDLLNEVLKIL